MPQVSCILIIGTNCVKKEESDFSLKNRGKYESTPILPIATNFDRNEDIENFLKIGGNLKLPLFWYVFTN